MHPDSFSKNLLIPPFNQPIVYMCKELLLLNDMNLGSFCLCLFWFLCYCYFSIHSSTIFMLIQCLEKYLNVLKCCVLSLLELLRNYTGPIFPDWTFGQTDISYRKFSDFFTFGFFIGEIKIKVFWLPHMERPFSITISGRNRWGRKPGYSSKPSYKGRKWNW